MTDGLYVAVGAAIGLILNWIIKGFSFGWNSKDEFSKLQNLFVAELQKMQNLFTAELTGLKLVTQKLSDTKIEKEKCEKTEKEKGKEMGDVKTRITKLEDGQEKLEDGQKAILESLDQIQKDVKAIKENIPPKKVIKRSIKK